MGTFYCHNSDLKFSKECLEKSIPTQFQNLECHNITLALLEHFDLISFFFFCFFF